MKKYNKPIIIDSFIKSFIFKNLSNKKKIKKIKFVASKFEKNNKNY